MVPARNSRSIAERPAKVGVLTMKTLRRANVRVLGFRQVQGAAFLVQVLRPGVQLIGEQEPGRH